MRIWQQGISDFSAVPSYSRGLSEHAKRVASPGAAVDVHGVAPGSYPRGVAPIEALNYPWCEMLLSTQMVLAAIRAERDGYDAVAFTCFLDPALDEARSCVDIPVVSILESSLLVASTVGSRLALIGLGRENERMLRERLGSKVGCERVVTVIGLEPGVTELDLDDPDRAADVERRFESCATQATKSGADLIIPAEGFLNLFLVQRGVRTSNGLPVLDSFGVLISHAEMMVRLWERTGLRMSRHGRHVRPSKELIHHVAGVTSLALSNLD